MQVYQPIKELSKYDQGSILILGDNQQGWSNIELVKQDNALVCITHADHRENHRDKE